MPFTPDTSNNSGSSFKPDTSSSFKPDGEPASGLDKLKAILLGDMTEGGKKANDEQYQRQGIERPIAGSAPLAIPAAGLPAMVLKMVQAASSTGAGRVGLNAGLGAAQGAINSPDDRLGGAVHGALATGGLAAGGELAGHALSDKLADWLMQRSVGMRKYFPGIGKILMSEGVGGTKNMMTNQVSDKLPAIEAQLQARVKGGDVPPQSGIAGKIQDAEGLNQAQSGLRGTVPSSNLSDQVAKVADKFKLSSGEVPANSQPEYDQVMTAAKNLRYTGGGSPAMPAPPAHVPTGVIDNAGNPITQKVSGGMLPEKVGSLTAEDLLSLKRQGDWPGYTQAGNKASSLEAEYMRAQANAARGELSHMSEGQSQAVPDLLGKERSLILAKQALEKPETIHQGNGSLAFFGRVPGQSLAESSGAHLTNKLGQLSKLIANPVVLQSLFGNDK